MSGSSTLSLFDLHCDTAHELYRRGASLCTNDLHIDLDRLCRYRRAVQVFAVWTPSDLCGAERFDNACRVIDALSEQIAQNADRIALCTTYDQIVAAHGQGKVAALLGIEGAGAFDGKLSHVDTLYQKGVRLVTVTWNGPNELACGVPDAGGVTEFGYQALARMAQLGMIVDLSHANPQSFAEIVEAYDGPLIASHSNAYEVCGHRRNLSATARKRLGLIGLNLYPPFVGEDVMAHIEAMRDCPLALGCDFDGVDALPDGIDGVQDLPKLYERIVQVYGTALADDVFFNHAMEFMKKYLR